MPALESIALASIFAASFVPDPTIATFKGQQGVCIVTQLGDNLQLMCFKVDASDWIRSSAPIGAYDPSQDRLCLLTSSGRDCKMLTAGFPKLGKSDRAVLASGK